MVAVVARTDPAEQESVVVLDLPPRLMSALAGFPVAAHGYQEAAARRLPWIDSPPVPGPFRPERAASVRRGRSPQAWGCCRA
jgi:hypothetical protein